MPWPTLFALRFVQPWYGEHSPRLRATASPSVFPQNCADCVSRSRSQWIPMASKWCHHGRPSRPSMAIPGSPENWQDLELPQELPTQWYQTLGVWFSVQRAAMSGGDPLETLLKGASGIGLGLWHQTRHRAIGVGLPAAKTLCNQGTRVPCR